MNSVCGTALEKHLKVLAKAFSFSFSFVIQSANFKVSLEPAELSKSLQSSFSPVIIVCLLLGTIQKP